MKKWIIIIFALISVYSLQANNTDPVNERKTKLLRQLSQTAQDDTMRLEIYSQIIRIVTNPQVELYYIDKLLREAERLDNNRYKCAAYFYRMALAYNQYDVEQVNKWMALLEPLARKEKLYDYIFNGRRCVIDVMMVNGEFEREEKAALEMLKDAKEVNNITGIAAAYQCLANNYLVTYRKDEAIKVLEEGYKVAYPTNERYILEINNSLIKTYEGLGDNANTIKWIKKLDNYLQQQIEKDPNTEINQRGWIMMAAVSYINYYTDIRDYKNAEKYVEKAEKYKMDGYGTFSYYYHIARYKYFYQIGNYEQALIETEILAEIYKELSPLSYSSMIYLKGRILGNLKRYDEAVSAFKNSFKIADSVNIVFLNKQTEQLKKDYDADQFLLEKEKINRKIQILSLSLILIAILILVVFIVHTNRVRQKLKKSEEEMRKMTEEAELANIAKEHFLSTISSAISVPLNAVVEGSLQLARDEVTDSAKRKDISQKLNKTSAKLMNLINSILDLSRLEAGMMKYRTEDIEILPFVREFISQPAYKEQEVKLEIPASEVALRVHADISRLQEVFKNLLMFRMEGAVLTMKVTLKNEQLFFKITNTQLAAYREQPQEIAIANEVNRLTIKRFGGQYEVNTDEVTVSFSLPLV